MGKRKMMKLSSIFRGEARGLLVIPLCYNRWEKIVTVADCDSKSKVVVSVGENRELTKDWQSLESMFAWYLRMNGRRSYGVIVSAFVDCLSGLSASGLGTS